MWVRVSYNGREHGWLLTANKRGPILLPLSDSKSARSEFEAQQAIAAAEVAKLEAGKGTEGGDEEDRPLNGAKVDVSKQKQAQGDSQGSAAVTAPGSTSGSGAVVTGGSGATLAPYMTSGGFCVFGGKGKAGEGGRGGRGVRGVEKYLCLIDGILRMHADHGLSLFLFFLAILYFGIREEADSFSLELGMLERGAVVKVLESSDLWVRVSYHGRDDGWVLTANKRGPMLFPDNDSENGRVLWEEQEALYAVAAAAAEVKEAEGAEEEQDRPIKGSSSSDVGGGGQGMPGSGMQEAEERPLYGGGEGGGVGSDGGVGVGSFMVAKGPLKIREEADSCSMDMGALETGSIVKVLESSDLWVRVAYHGKEFGWVLTANKRGPMLVLESNPALAETAWGDQESQHAASVAAAQESQEASEVVEERPIKGSNPSESVGEEGGG
ncbi:unnamed protein product, partial [Choristocarpus tenellus]